MNIFQENDNSEEYRIGIVGAGMIACGYDTPESEFVLTHAHAIKNNNKLKLSGFFDINVEKSKAAVLLWGGNVFSTLLELLSCSDIVCCAVPDKFHWKVMMDILKLNPGTVKLVICEKPIATDITQADEIIRLYKNTGIPIVVNYTRRFIPGIREVKKNIANLGKLIVGECHYGKGLIHNGSHMVNIIDYLIGLDRFHCIVTESCICDYSSEDISIDFKMVSDYGESIYFHVIPDNLVSVFQFELFFEKGRISYDSGRERMEIFHVERWDKYPECICYRPARIIHTDRSSAIPMLYEDVLGKLIHEVPLCSDGESALRTLSICKRVSESKMRRENEKK